MDIHGARILLTGASGGLGRAIAQELARRGADLVLTARSASLLEDLAARTGGEVRVADLADRSDVEELCATLGEIDVLIANAGVGGNGSVLESAVDSIAMLSTTHGPCRTLKRWPTIRHSWLTL